MPDTMLGHGDAELIEHQPQLGEPQDGRGDRWSASIFLTI